MNYLFFYMYTNYIIQLINTVEMGKMWILSRPSLGEAQWNIL